MCIIIGKYFPDIGWVAFKNRDRNYIPDITFKKQISGGVEILFFWDNVTQYCEGFNSAGVGILSASLMVLDDEKEIESRCKEPSKDGIKIKKALKFPDVRAVVAQIIKSKLTGNTLVFDKNRMFLIEGAWRPGEYKSKGYDYVVREIPKDETIVRTNHGIWLPWAGYQRGTDDENEQMSRISSESRRLIAQSVSKDAKTPTAVIDGLTRDFTHNGQLNALRTTSDRKKMRTTSQIMIIPGEMTMHVRPVQSNIEFNFWKLNHPAQRTWVEILSNRVLYQNLKNLDPSDDPPFAHNLTHTLIK